MKYSADDPVEDLYMCNRKLIHIVYPVVSLKIVLEEVIHIAEDDFYEWKQAWFSTPDLDILQMRLDIHVNNAQV